MSRALCVRLDNAGDVLLAGPALRAMAAGSDEVVLLAGPNGAAAGRLMPGVDEVLVWRCPWIDPEPPTVVTSDVDGLIAKLAAQRFDVALILTSFHQSPLPMALVLRQAGVPWVGAISDDYPGSLLDLRHRLPDDLPEAERALSLATAAGYQLPSEDTGGLAVRGDLPDVSDLLGSRARPYVVVHPGTSVPARACPPEILAEAVELLSADGWDVVVTGAPGETALTRLVSGSVALDLGGHTDLGQLAAVLAGAAVAVAGNTGPAHLAAAVGTPVVSLFAPTVPAVRWAPYGVPTVVLGDQNAACRDTRATTCPVAGHPCLSSVRPVDLVTAVHDLAALPPVSRSSFEMEVAG